MNIEPIFNVENGVLIGGNFRNVTHVEIPEGVTAIRCSGYTGEELYKLCSIVAGLSESKLWGY